MGFYFFHLHIAQNHQETRVHAERSEELMNTVTVRAENIGMRVNSAKTQLLCVSAGNSDGASVVSYIRHNGGKITSTAELKILGFKFGNAPSIKTHVSYMLQKARNKLWTLRLKKGWSM